MRFAVTAVLLLLVWWVLSGRFDLLHFGTGIVASLLIAANFPGWRDDRAHFRPLRFVLFLPWLVGQIILSNLRVARMVFLPRMPIRPVFISKRPGVEGDRALTGLGACLTLTPGTLTVDVRKNEIFVHALDMASADDVEQDKMAHAMGRVLEAGAP
jgi:multicomponent Na+:H+ antiporter subunit E